MTSNSIARRLLGAAAAAIARKLLPDAVPKNPGTALARRSEAQLAPIAVPDSGKRAPSFAAAELMRGGPTDRFDPRHEIYSSPIAPLPVYYAPPPPPALPRKRRKKTTVTETRTYWRS